jgi:hypothetical protein
MAKRSRKRSTDTVEELEISNSMRRGLADVAAGRVVPARQTIGEMIDELNRMIRTKPTRRAPRRKK